MIATKEQECEALFKIKKIINDLGENSYLAAALDGVFELANQNIIEDASYSFTDKVRLLQSEIDSLNNELNNSSRKIDDLEAELNITKDTIERLKSKTFNNDELLLLRNLINFNIDETHNDLDLAIQDAIISKSVENLKSVYNKANTLKSLNEKVHKLISY